MARYRCAVLVTAIVLAVLAAAIPSSAQTSLATLRGRVTDQQGGVLPGVTVTARQTETNTTRSGITNQAGQFYLPSLPAGTWEISADLQGFSTSKRTATLRVGQEATADFTMQLGTVAELVEVTGRAAIVETQSTVGGMVDIKELDALPTIDRNFAGLAQLTPGISSTGQSGSGFSAAGQHQFQNQIFVDGATNAQQFYGTQAESYPQDWVQEFQVMTNGFSAEFGQATGGVLNVITRSGTNNFSGRFYGFYRSSKFDRPNYAGRFTNSEPQFLTVVPEYHNYRAGGFLGGPIAKDKLFFFGAFEDYVNTQNSVLSISPYWINQGQPSVVPGSNTSRVYLAKVDANLSEHNRLSVRHGRTFREDVNCTGQGGDGCNSAPLWTFEKRATFNGPLWSVLANFTSTLGNNSFNEFRVFYGVNKLIITGNAVGKYGADLFNDFAELPKWVERYYPGAYFGTAVTGGLEGEDNLYVMDNFMFVKGKHQFKIGAQLARVGFFMDIDGSQKGRWYFEQDRVFSQSDPLSYPYQFTISVGTAKYSQPSWNPSFFVQDTWQVRNSLTLNVGLRYDIDNTIKVGNDLVDGYNAYFTQTYGGTAPLTKVNTDYHEVQPRLGFVWTPTQDQRTTVRGSFGVFFDQNHFNYNDVYINQTLLAKSAFVFNANDPTANPFYNAANPAASKAALQAYLAKYFPYTPDISVLPTPKQTIRRMAPDFHVPHTIQETIGFTHQFRNKIAVTSDYVHSHGYDVVLQINKNLAFVNGQYVNIDPRLSAFNQFTNLGYINYNALVSRVAYHGTKLRVGASYTLGKATSNSNATGVGGGAATNPLDLSIDDGPTTEDRRHVLVVDYSYVFPLGFQVAGIARYQSALPYSATNSKVVFARPDGYPRNSLRGDGESQVDLRVSKAFKIHGRAAATFFWEMFNLLNTTNFMQYQGNLLSSSFGIPQGAQAQRRQQVGFKFDF